MSRGGAAAADVLFQYLGLSPLLSKEEHKDLAGTLLRTKIYSLDARGQRTGMTHTPAGAATERYTYGVDPQSSVSLLLDAGSGAVRAAYAYRPYGAENPALTKGDADPNAVLNPYRFQGKRLDVISGTLDMGARRFGPDIARFLQADRYPDARADLGLALDPLTRNRYAFAGGNPVSFLETDGHAFTTGDDGGCLYPSPGPYCGEAPVSEIGMLPASPTAPPTAQPGSAPAVSGVGAAPSLDAPAPSAEPPTASPTPPMLPTFTPPTLPTSRPSIEPTARTQSVPWYHSRPMLAYHCYEGAVAGIFVTGIGVVHIVGGAGLIGGAGAAASTGGGLVASVPMVVLGAEMIAVGAVITAAGIYTVAASCGPLWQSFNGH